MLLEFIYGKNNPCNQLANDQAFPIFFAIATVVILVALGIIVCGFTGWVGTIPCTIVLIVDIVVFFVAHALLIWPRTE